MEDLPLGRIAALVPEFAVKDLPLGRTLMTMMMISKFLPLSSSSSPNIGLTPPLGIYNSNACIVEMPIGEA